MVYCLISCVDLNQQDGQKHSGTNALLHRNDPKFSDRMAWANSVDPNQTARSLIRVYTVCHSV